MPQGVETAVRLSPYVECLKKVKVEGGPQEARLLSPHGFFIVSIGEPNPPIGGISPPRKAKPTAIRPISTPPF